VVMLHLNDSRAGLASRLDRHEHIGAGRIGAPGMAAVLQNDWLGQLPTYLETPGMDSGYDQVNLQRAYELIDGRQPGPLPPEAFSLRSSRSRSAPPAG
jgi:deoxyribonuclease-4